MVVLNACGWGIIGFLCINQLTRLVKFTMFGEVSVSEGDWVNVLNSQATANYMHYGKG